MTLTRKMLLWQLQLLLLVLAAISAPLSLVTHSLLGILITYVVWSLLRAIKQYKPLRENNAPNLDLIRPHKSGAHEQLHELAATLERSRKEERRIRERMQAIFDTVQEGIVTLDEQGAIISANPAALRLFAVTTDRFIGTRLWQWVILDELQSKLLCSKQPVALSVEQLVEGAKSSGERFPLSLHLDTLELDGEEHSVATLADVSDLLGARDKLALSQAVKSSILSSALDAIITIDAEGNIVEFNPAAERTFGFTRSTVLGQEMAALIIPPAMREAHRQGMRHYLGTGEHNVLGQRIEVTGLHRDGHEFPIELAVAPIHLDRRTLFTAYVRDISERRLAEAELEQAKNKAEAASRAKGDFLAVMSHELRTPLNAIIGSVSLLSEGALSDEQQALLSNAAQASRAMLWLVNDILDFSKIEVGKLELENYPFDLSFVIEEVLFLLSGRAQDKAIDLAVTLDPNLPVKVMGDAGRIRQVLINLVGNAIKFTEQGGVCIGLARDEHDNIRIVVDDTGIGIADTVQDKLFSEFMQADSAYSRKYGGTGLGLAICKRLTELMGGKIGLSSQLGKGSRFWISLPLQSVDTVTQGVPVGLPEQVCITEANDSLRKALKKQLRYWNVAVVEQEASGEGAQIAWDNAQGQRKIINIGEGMVGDYIPKPVLPRYLVQALLEQPVGDLERLSTRAEQSPRIKQHGRVLIAEDSPANQLVAETMLQRAGYEVDCVSNGLEAVQAVTAGKYDLVLMDLSMPEMDGITATQILRGQGAELPILAMTANVLKEDLDRCLDAGMNGYVTKPVVQADLLAALEQWLNGQVPEAKETPQPVVTTLAGMLWDDRIVAQLRADVGGAVPRMLDLYAEEAALRSHNVEQAIIEEDLKALRHESHALKSSSGTLGAVAMQRLAEQLERCCIADNLVEALVLAQKVTPLLNETLANRPT